jgi:cell wall-associated NlpC family hydrolase
MEIIKQKYLGAQFKHLGLSIDTGIDCFNLIKQFYKDELNIDIPYSTRTWCNIIDENWYYKTHEELVKNITKEQYGWKEISKPEPYCLITMCMGTSTITNHCAMYIEQNKMLQILQNTQSHVATYGNFYKQYTTGIYRWIGMKD